MTSQLRQGGRLSLASLASLALALGIWAVAGSSAMAHGGGGGGGGHGGGGFGGGFGGGHMGGMGMGGMGMGHMGMGYGGMGGFGRMGGLGYGNRGFYGGYGGYGFFPFFGGYGLYGLGYGYGYPYYGGYGLGYGGYGMGYGLGYGGYGLGYGGYGYGYPYYGGYGYGYGYPYYGYGNGYGYPYYSNVYSTPGAGVTYTSAYVAPGGSAANTVMPQGRYLGIDEEPVIEPNGKRGMKVANVYPGTPAQRAGLKVGDVLYSINGYLTEQRGNLAWIIANAAPNNQLKMTVKTAGDGQTHSVTAQLQ